MKFTARSDRYDSMKYRRCGNSGIMLPSISLGLWHNFGDVDDPETFKQILFRAFDLGITHFDLANNYGPPPGSAEKNFGKILNSDFKAYRDEMIISSKAGYLMWPGPYGEFGSRKHLMASLEKSLKRMGLDYIDIFYSHRPDPGTPIEETMMALHSAVTQGKALYVGLSNYSAEQTREALEILEDLGTPCLIHQPRYSMFERWVEGGLLDLLEEKGIGSIPFSPLAQGLLTNRYLKEIPADSRVSKPHGFLKREHLTPPVLQKISSLNSLALQRKQSLAQMALTWLLKDNRVTSVLIGASSVNQLEDNLMALTHLEFNSSELAQIEEILT